MTRIERLPYATPHPQRIQVGQWQLLKDGQIQPLGSLLPDWDPAVTLRAAVPIHIDIAGLLADCFLDPDAQLQIISLWYSPGTVLRGRGQSEKLNTANQEMEVQLELSVDGVYLAKNIDLAVSVVLMRPGSYSHPFAPRLPGSLLYQHHRNLQLEGEGSRFPVEVLDFSSSGYFPSTAAWVLFWNPDDLHQTLLGGDIRLYINARHERVKRAVSENRAEDADIREAIRLDTAKTLIYGALKNTEFVANPDLYADGSIGSAISRMLRLYLPNFTIEQLHNSARRPNLFDALLQDRLRAYWEA